MGITDLFIKRPVLTTLLIVSLMAAGVLGYTKLPTSDLPPVDYPTITVSAALPGASPETMASSVTAPLEGALADLPGLETMTSVSSNGSCYITLTFRLDQDINAAAQDVQSGISKADLPSGMPSPPSYSKSNSAASPVFYLSMRSDVLPLTRVNQLAKDFVSLKIARIPGVAQVTIYGERKQAVRIQIDPRKLASHGLTLSDVASAVGAENSNLPGGSLKGKYSSPTIASDGQLTKAKAYNQITLANKNGQVLKLSQVGRAIDSVADNQSGSWWKGEPSITLAVLRQPGSNTVALVDQVKQLLPQVNKELPPSVRLEVLYDGSIPIRESVEDVQFTLMLAVGLVVLVVALFLKRLAATVITSLAVPTSLITTFAAMDLLGYSLDTLSLMALTLSVGFVVDDAIVMLENVVRHMDMGKSPMRAALEGGREITFTIISTTLSLVAVFLPVAMMSGMLGRLLSEFAMTITVAICLSTVVSLTLTPMLCSRFLHKRKNEGPAVHDPSQAGGFIYRPLFRAYSWALHLALRHRVISVVVFLALVAGNVHLFYLVPMGFIPSEDRGYFMAVAMGRQGISFDAMTEHTNAVAAVIARHPAVKGVLPLVGNGPMNQGMMVVVLKPRADRKQSVDQVIAALYGAVNQFPGARVFMTNPPPISLGGGGGGQGNIQYTLVGADTDELYAGAQKLVASLRGRKELVGVNSNLMIASPQIQVDIDRQKAAQLGVRVDKVQEALFSAYTSRRVSMIYGASDQYQVLMELLPRFLGDADSLRWLYLRATGGALVPLSVVSSMRHTLGPVQVNHFGQLPSVDIAFNLAPGVSLGAATALVRESAAETLPASVTGSFQGSAGQFEKSLMSMAVLMLMALGVIYVILGILYESFIHPLTILAGLPSATLGALATLLIFGQELNLYGFVGLLLLIGIVKKNAIMMVDFALQAQREQGKGALEAITEGALTRFRPIMMTSVASFMGILPVAMGIGAGGASRQGLGLAVCGGLLISQFVTLVLTPVIFTYFDKISGDAKKAEDHPAVAKPQAAQS